MYILPRLARFNLGIYKTWTGRKSSTSEISLSSSLSSQISLFSGRQTLKYMLSTPI